MERPPGSCVCAAGVTLVVSFMVAGMSSGLGFGGRVGKIQAAAAGAGFTLCRLSSFVMMPVTLRSSAR